MSWWKDPLKMLGVMGAEMAKERLQGKDAPKATKN
jgi:hypothetical protein